MQSFFLQIHATGVIASQHCPYAATSTWARKLAHPGLPSSCMSLFGAHELNRHHLHTQFSVFPKNICDDFGLAVGGATLASTIKPSKTFDNVNNSWFGTVLVFLEYSGISVMLSFEYTA